MSAFAAGRGRDRGETGPKRGPGARRSGPRSLVFVLPALALVALAGCGGPTSDSSPEARLQVSELLGGGDTLGYTRARGPRPFSFPEDHGPHPRFRTEWWYLTGHLNDHQGRPFGYQATIFRVRVSPPDDERGGPSPGAHAPDAPPDDAPAGDEGSPSRGSASAWATDQLYMSHVAVTDVEGERFLTEERVARGALGLAGATAEPFRVWLEDGEIRSLGSDAFPAAVRFSAEGFALDLRVQQGKGPVLQGEEGWSPKGPEPGNASFYYSLPRMPTRGTLTLGEASYEVEGTSWLDREWSTSALGEELAGWDWLALQLDGGRELMIYRLRRRDGGASSFSRAAWIDAAGRVETVGPDRFVFEPLGWWESPVDGARYPVEWRVELPARGVSLEVEPLLDDQEWRTTVRYWEGAVRARGRGPEGAGLEARGYLEATGYGDPPGATGRGGPGRPGAPR